MGTWIKEAQAYLRSVREMNAAAAVLKTTPEKFEGLYESVYHLAKRDGISGAEALEEWYIRAERLHPETALSRLTAFCQAYGTEKKRQARAAKLLLGCFRKAGIRRAALSGGGKNNPSKGNALTLSAANAIAYRALDGHTLRAGERTNVISAAWYVNGRVAEHGLAGEI